MYTGRQNKKRKYQRYLLFKTWCPEQDSNLHVSQHSHLKRARLPFRHLGIPFGKRAENEARTRDPDLGKVVLYQLSYFRICFFVKRRRLELPRHNCHYPLKVARLPIPPSLRDQSEVCPEQDSNLHVSQHSHLKRARLPFRHLGIPFGKRAENEARTRDPDLGKVVLYQLSYFRVIMSSFPNAMQRYDFF